jgi:hypothetical protein
MDAAQVATELMKELKSARFVIAPTGMVHFTTIITSPLSGNNDGLLNYKIESSRPERSPIPAQWVIQAAGGKAIHLSVTNYPGLPNRLLIPGSVMQGAQSLILSYHRLDSGSSATLFMAQNGQEPELLIPSGSWAMNLSRGLLMILCRLAFLSALGLTAGCLLSTPVAVFAAFFIMVLLALSGYVESVATSGVFYIPHEGPALSRTWLDNVILSQFKWLNRLTQPLLRLDPVPLIEEGRRISWLMTAHAVAWLVGLYTAVTALIGMILFNRRELG